MAIKPAKAVPIPASMSIVQVTRISPSSQSEKNTMEDFDLCQDFGHEKSGVYAARNTSLGSDNALSKRSKDSSITSAGTL